VTPIVSAPPRTPDFSARPRAERHQAGRALRERVLLEELGRFEPTALRPDPVAILEDQARGRVQGLVAVRHGRMLSSPFGFFRGAAAVMAAGL
jgi:hypothetical protein